MGSAVRLECNATGNPAPVITWRRPNPGQRLSDGRPSSIGESLMVSVRSIAEAGSYVCEARNTLGLVSKSMNVNVRRKYQKETSISLKKDGVNFHSFYH